jgi:hypothetical protein
VLLTGHSVRPARYIEQKPRPGPGRVLSLRGTGLASLPIPGGGRRTRPVERECAEASVRRVFRMIQRRAHRARGGDPESE